MWKPIKARNCEKWQQQNLEIDLLVFDSFYNNIWLMNKSWTSLLLEKKQEPTWHALQKDALGENGVLSQACS